MSLSGSAMTRNIQSENYGTTMNRHEIHQSQRAKLTRLFSVIYNGNSFYQNKFSGISFDALNDSLNILPFTTRRELEQDQLNHPPYGTNLSYPVDSYCRLHQTSGSSGRPLRWLDTEASWDWWKDLWQTIFSAAGVTKSDRLAFPFSFGPFVGFWGAFDAAAKLGFFVVPAGGMATTARLRMIIENKITVICCTPTYALRMIEVAGEENIDIANSSVKSFIVAGEPGGHIPEIRSKIESAWNARLFDHSGMTEIGPLGFECKDNPADMHLIESDCIAECIDPSTLQNVADGQAGELVITNLGRLGSPVIRYRTGDQVRLDRSQCKCGRHFVRMLGGINGRIDDMFIVRGNNVFPSAVEAVIRRFPEVIEFGVEYHQSDSLAKIKIKLEADKSNVSGDNLAGKVAHAIQETLSFKPEIEIVPANSLPRFEMKANRFKKVVIKTI